MISRIGGWTYEYEYRINKKGCECFRSGNYDQVKAKLAELQAKRPGVYTMQSRSRCYNRADRPQVFREWSIWS